MRKPRKIRKCAVRYNRCVGPDALIFNPKTDFRCHKCCDLRKEMA